MTEPEMAKIAEMLYRKMSGSEDREIAELLRGGRGQTRNIEVKPSVVSKKSFYVQPDGSLTNKQFPIVFSEQDKELAKRLKAVARNVTGSLGLCLKSED